MRNAKLFLAILITSAILYFLHRIALSQMESGDLIRGFFYSLETVYLFFTACSMLILSAVLFVRRRNLDATGQAFIAATFVKMVLAYGFLYPALSTDSPSAGPGKMNFFLVFMLFLMLETIVCTRLLNKS